MEITDDDGVSVNSVKKTVFFYNTEIVIDQEFVIGVSAKINNKLKQQSLVVSLIIISSNRTNAGNIEVAHGLWSSLH